MLQSALEHLVKGIVDHPGDVKVVAAASARGEVLEVHVNPEDLGRVIGRAGRTAKALRTLVTALADGRRVRVDVVDTDD
ncbi:MAG TPA: RNA-binding protein [Agromyces sp.]